ncbi:protein odr-4 homolog [Anthonomus grandis grandis]|uniref:protein odr-4 homolog n=1 Tax=Anthonomus grandis grandis TaxID=2921223 RepID=UPI00216572FC|nr:protein odr-4 homolog [Anthonomus grandis grandis]
MVRYAEGDENLLKYLASIANDFKCAIGLVLGQVTAQRYNLIHLAKTPPFQTSDPQNEEKTIQNLTTVTDINEGWIADHARQTTRMLPGGMYVLGIFIVSDEELLTPFNSKLKSLLNGINKTLQAQSYLFGNGDNEKLIIQYSPKNLKCLAKTYDVDTFNVQPVELKLSQKGVKLVGFECLYQIDHVYHLKEEDSRGPLRKHIKVILEDINKHLETAIILFDNDLKDPDEKIENMSKKKKVPRGSSNKIDNHDDCSKPIPVAIFKKCKNPENYTSLEPLSISGQIHIIGEISLRLWLNAKASFGDAIVAVKEDLMRSLSTRMEMHWDSLTEEELGEEINSVHEPPRRVLITLPESNVTISDYLFPGEGPEDVKASLEELLDIKADSQLELLDLEGQADIAQYYGSQVPCVQSKITSTDSSKFMYLLGLGVAFLMLIVSIIVHFYMTD